MLTRHEVGCRALGWKPINPSHAIERVRLLLQFASPMPPKMIETLGARFDKSINKWSLSARIPTEIVDVQLDNITGVSTSKKSVGWQSQRATQPGKIVEAIVLDPNAFFYESAEYFGWKKYLERFNKIGGFIVEKINDDISVESITLEYWDRFVHDTPDTTPPAGLFCKELISILSGTAVSGVDPWHLHRGWFESQGDRKFLVNQNIDVHVATIGSGQQRSVALYTRVELRSPTKNLELSGFKGDIAVMHDVSKRVVSDALDLSMRQQVGLA